MILVPERSRIEKDAVVRIYRTLRGKGKLVVTAGQEVTPDEIIGTGEFSSGFRRMNLSKLLEVLPKDVKKYLRKPLSSRVYKDELLAYKKAGLLNRAKVIVCPVDGILDFINEKTGEIRITRSLQKQDLPAGVYGIIESFDENLGQVVIKTQVSKVFGICGSGMLREGTLRLIGKRYDLIGKSMISTKYDGSILVGGSLITKDTIMAAISADVSGIITGGINASDYKSIAGGRLVFPKRLENDIGVAIVICEGFGSQPLGEDIYEILSKYEGKFVQLDGNKATISLPSFQSSSMIKLRKTQLPKDNIVSEDQLVELALGQIVRVVSPSYRAEQGKIIAIDKTLTRLPSGILANLLTLETKRRKIRVPTQNVEVIG